MTSVPVHFLDDDETLIAIEELIGASGLAREEIEALVDLGVFEPHRQTGQWLFSARCIVSARRAARLRSDFELDAVGVALALAYLDQIEALQARVHELECQLLR
jgi:chaperone modulatory protein CbpM